MSGELVGEKLLSSRRPNDHATRHVVTAAAVLLGLGQVGLLFIALSILLLSSIILSLDFLVLELLLLVGLLGFRTLRSRPPSKTAVYLRGIVSKTDDPHASRLLLHSIFNWVGVLDFFVLLYSLIFVLTGKPPWNPLWAVLLGASGYAIIQYSIGVLNLFGQRYEDNRGASFDVAAGLGRLASRLLSREKSEGVDTLLTAFQISDVLFENREYRPKDFLDAWSTVEGLNDSDDIRFGELKDLADSLGELPKRSGLPDQFHKFLEAMGWPRGFEVIKSDIGRRSSIYDRLPALAALVTFIGGIASLVFPKELEAPAYAALSGFVAQQAATIFGLIALVFGAIYPFRTLTYFVPFRLIKQYMLVQPSNARPSEPSPPGDELRTVWKIFRKEFRPSFFETLTLVSAAYIGSFTGDVANFEIAVSLIFAPMIVLTAYLIFRIVTRKRGSERVGVIGFEDWLLGVTTGFLFGSIYSLTKLAVTIPIIWVLVAILLPTLFAVTLLSVMAKRTVKTVLG